MGVLHLLQQLVGTDAVVAFKNDRIDFNLASSLDIEVYHDAALLVISKCINSRGGVDGDIGIAFLKVIGTNLIFGSGEEVLGNYIASRNLHLLLEFVYIILLHSIKMEVG